MTKFLYEFGWNCGRMGALEGRFLATPEEVEKLIGKHVYFGEVLGKHSEIYGNISKEDISLVTDNVEFLSLAEQLKVDLESGFNPLEYTEDFDEEE